MSDNFLMINGKLLHVINSSVQMEERGRQVWRIVTEDGMPADVAKMMYETMPGVPPAAEVQPATPADATVARSVEECPGGESCPGHPTAPHPFQLKQDSGNKCMTCGGVPGGVAHMVEQLREVDADLRQELFRNSGPAAPRPLLDGPPLLPACSTYVPCLGQECTGCSDPECWTVRADGGDQ